MSAQIEPSNSYRPIRSYVRREGRITRAQSRALNILWPKYGIGGGDSLLTATNLFGDERSLTLEIGFGNGNNLAELALAHPNNGYIGVDVYRPGAGKLMLELEQLEISNVRIILQDAVDVIYNRFSDRSLDTILIYFPDPWPKKRHQKRRILCPDFLHQLAHCLKPKGTLHITTDCSNYAKTILQFILLEPLLTQIDKPEQHMRPPLRQTITKYEARGIGRGYPIAEILAYRP